MRGVPIVHGLTTAGPTFHTVSSVDSRALFGLLLDEAHDLVKPG